MLGLLARRLPGRLLLRLGDDVRGSDIYLVTLDGAAGVLGVALLDATRSHEEVTAEILDPVNASSRQRADARRAVRRDRWPGHAMTSGVSAGASVDQGRLTPSLAQEWDELAGAASASPFLYPAWHAAWADAFSSGRLDVVTVRRGSQLVAVAPLVCRSGVARASANWHTPRFGAVATDDDAVTAIVRFLVRRLRRRLDVTMLSPDDPMLAALRCAGRPTIVRTVTRQPYVDVSGALDDYVAALPRKRSKELARLERRARDRGEVTVTVADGSRRLEPLLEEGFRLESSGWKAERGEAIATSPSAQAFYMAIGRWAAACGWLRLAFLELDRRRIAFDYCLEAGGSLYVLKGGFDPAYRELGPGTLLTWSMLRRAFASDASSYELLGNAVPYKLAWTDRTRPMQRIQVFGRGPVGEAERLAWSRGRPLAKALLATVGR